MNIPQRPKSNHPIPENAKKVFQGRIFSIYQWPQIMFDGSIQTFEKAQKSDSVSVVATTSDEKIILLNQEQPGTVPFVSCPGGVIDEGENPIEAASRELREETGYECRDLELWKAFQPYAKIDWAIYMFVARECQKIGEQNLDVGEKISLNLFTFEEFIQMVLDEKLREKELLKLVMRAVLDNRLNELRQFLFDKK